MDYPIESRSPHRGTPLRVLKEEKYNIQESIPYRNSKNILFRRSLELKRPPIVHVKRNCNSLTLSNEDSEFVTKTSSLTSSLEDEPTFLGEMNKKFDCYNSAGENRRTLPSLEFGTDFSFQNILNGKLVENQDNSKSEDSESNYSFESDHGAEDFDSTLLGFREGIDSFPHAPNFRSSGLIEMFEENVRHAVEQERDFQDSSHELSSPVPGFNAPSQVYGTVEQSAAKRSPTSIASKTASTQKKTKLTKKKPAPPLPRSEAAHDYTRKINVQKSFIKNLIPRGKKVIEKTSGEVKDVTENLSMDLRVEEREKLPAKRNNSSPLARQLFNDFLSSDGNGNPPSRPPRCFSSSGDLSSFISGPVHLQRSIDSSETQQDEITARVSESFNGATNSLIFEPPRSDSVLSDFYGVNISEMRNFFDHDEQVEKEELRTGFSIFRTGNQYNEKLKADNKKTKDKKPRKIEKIKAKISKEKVSDKDKKKTLKISSLEDNDHKKNRFYYQKACVQNLKVKKDLQLKEGKISVAKKDSNPKKKSDRESFEHFKFWKKRLSPKSKDFEQKEQKKNAVISMRRVNTDLNIAGISKLRSTDSGGGVSKLDISSPILITSTEDTRNKRLSAKKSITAIKPKVFDKFGNQIHQSKKIEPISNNSDPEVENRTSNSILYSDHYSSSNNSMEEKLVQSLLSHLNNSSNSSCTSFSNDRAIINGRENLINQKLAINPKPIRPLRLRPVK